MRTAADDALLAGFGVGDPDAATVFVRRHQARVFGLARSIVGDAALAEDVAQEAFIRAWHHAAAYDPRRGSVPTWLLAITRNVAIDALRMRRPNPVDPAVLAGYDVPAQGPGGPRRQRPSWGWRWTTCGRPWPSFPPSSAGRWCWPLCADARRERWARPRVSPSGRRRPGSGAGLFRLRASLGVRREADSQ